MDNNPRNGADDLSNSSHKETDSKYQIKTTKIVYPQVYSYTLPDLPQYNGAQKIGYTERQNVDDRIREQVHTPAVDLRYIKQWYAPAFYLDTNNQPTSKSFIDKDFHRYLRAEHINQRKDLPGEEWFYFTNDPAQSKILFDNFRRTYNTIAQGEKIPYKLRPEQEAAVTKALTYFRSHSDNNDTDEQPAFLWNAKPRFGKTLAAYDLAKRLNAKSVLIVTNRPAIANSWYDDYAKFVEGYEFVSATSSLSDRPTLTREQFILRNADHDNNLRQITFLSLQDLKGSHYFGGKIDKLKWVADLHWDLLIIDEAHEGVDTNRTDVALDIVKRKYTLYLSGTPFKMLASEKFSDDAIYNWTYLDEQQAKQAELVALPNGDDIDASHTNLPDMRLFTYRISEMTTNEINEGVDLDGEDCDYAFDLNEFFATKNGKFIHADDVRAFLHNLSVNTKYPFSTPELRNELKHTFWYVGNRVDSCKALAKLLKEDPVFKDYEVIIAAGDGKSFEEEADNYNANEKSFDRVNHAISEHDKTITLSCGQLTTGVTVKQWTAVLMLTDIKSPALYMQAAFRAQNPYEHIETVNGKSVMVRKKSAYLFDFAPTRVLEIYGEFANGLQPAAVEGRITEAERKDNIKRLLNFFPVISEDTNGRMIELDAEKVLTFPNALAAKDIVNARFMTNLLFNDTIKNVFNIPKEAEAILSKTDIVQGKHITHNDKPLDLDEARTLHDNREKTINENKQAILGDKIYETAYLNNIDRIVDNTDHITDKDALAESLSTDIAELSEKPIARAKEVLNLTKAEVDSNRQKVLEVQRNAISEYVNSDLSNDVERAAKKEELKEALKNSIEQTAVEEPVTMKADHDIENERKSKEDEIKDHLRAFTRTIPMCIMANNTGSEITIDNFDTVISDADFEDLTNITKEEFHMLRDGFDYTDDNGARKHFEGVFNRYRFNAAIAEFVSEKNKLGKYWLGEQRDIFELVPNQKNNQIFTPRKVVTMMIDDLQAERPDLFNSTNSRFIDLYMKSGLYIAEIAKRLFNNTRHFYNSDDECMTHILTHQVYGLAPTNILYNITTGFIFGGLPNISKNNFREYNLLDDAKNGTAQTTLNKLFNKNKSGDSMFKFDAVVGNPPYHYETGRRKIPIYQNFLMSASELARYGCFVTPDGFIKGGQQLEPLRDWLITTKHLKSVEFHRDEIFSNVAVNAAITLFDYTTTIESPLKTIIGLDGKLSSTEKLDWRYRDVEVDKKKYQILNIYDKLMTNESVNMSSLIPGWAPFGLNSKCWRENQEKFYNKPDSTHSTKILVGEGKHDFYYIDPSDKFDYEGSDGRIEYVKLDNSDKWKMVFPKAGLVREKPLPTLILEPGVIFTDKYLCIFANSKDEALNAQKYFNSRFYRAGLDSKMTSWNLYRSWHSNIPVQDFTDHSDIDWNSDIDGQLFKKYKFTEQDIELITNYIK